MAGDEARTARAVRAAATAGRQLGLEVREPRVLYDVFSVVVHLAPSPVVVRVPTVLPPSYALWPEAQLAQQRAELAVTGWLADHGHPVVPPSPLVPREPVARQGFSMTFWQLVEEVRVPEPDTAARLAMTAKLHAVLADYTGENLNFWAPFATYVPDGLTALESLPDLLPAADLDRARREWSTIEPIVSSRDAFEREFPGVAIQTIHGDAPFHNMITTPAGEYWADFELVTLGPVESDVALAGADAVATYDEAAVALGLRASDPRVLRLVEAAGSLATVACLAMAPQLPMLVGAVEPALAQWRSTPLFTGP